MTTTNDVTPIPGGRDKLYQWQASGPTHNPGRAPNVGGRVAGLLPGDLRADGLDTRTPLDALPADFTPEWAAAREALEKALDELDAYDSENDELLSERWERAADAREREYMRAIQNGETPPKRPKGGWHADMADKRPAVVAGWYRLKSAKDKADRAAWELLVQLAPQAIPDAQAEIEAAGEAYIAAQEAMEKARSAFEAAFSHRVDLERFAAGTDEMTGGMGLPTEVVAPGGDPVYSAKVIVRNALRYLQAHYGDADTAPRFPAKRKIRAANGAEFDLDPGLARQMEGQGIEFIDGFPPESEINRSRGARPNASPRMGPGDSTSFKSR
jgi:hypothetical protein